MRQLAIDLWRLCIAAVAIACAIPRAVAEPPLPYSEDQIPPLPTVTAEDDSLRAIVEELSDRVTTVEEENRWLKSMTNQGWLQKKDPVSQGEETAIEFQGRIHVDVWAFPDSDPGINAFESGDPTISPQDRLELRRARFAAEGELPYETLYKLDFELSEASQPQFRDLYVGWDDLPFFGELLFGNQKRPYGLDHLNSSNFNVFMERPFIVQAFNRNNRRFGFLAYGVSQDESWNWRYGVVNLREIQSDGLYSSDHWQLEAAGRLARTFWNGNDESKYLHLALASGLAVPDGNPAPGAAKNEAQFRTEPEARTNMQWLDTGIIDGANVYSVFGVESVLNRGPWQVVCEYMNLWLDRDPMYGSNLHFQGGYVYLSYFLTDHYQPWNRKRGIIGRVKRRCPNECNDWDRMGAWQIAVRWSRADLSDDNILGGDGSSLAFGLNWYWTPRSRVQFNCIYGDISDHFPVGRFTSGDYVTLGTRVAVDF